MAMATYAIGDVQGSFEELQALLGTIGFERNKDCLWFVGDLVNRGPASLATLRFVRDLSARARTVLGNQPVEQTKPVTGRYNPSALHNSYR